MKTYKILVSFGGYIGAEQEYEIDADSVDAAIEEAQQTAADEELTAEDWNQTDDDEWEVTIGFAGFIGAEETYTVYGDSEEEAVDNAIEEAKWDLSAEVIAVDEEKARLIAEMLGRDEITVPELDAIEDDWKKFYREPERFEGSPVLDMINQYLDEMEAGV